MAVSRINEAGLNVNQYGNRNLTINGAMQVNQRGTVTGITGSGYGPDRCAIVCSNSGTYTLSQAADAPSGSGFDKSLDVACTSSDTYGTAADVTHLRISSLESQDCMKFEHGTSSAKKLTVQFWVKCSYADTFGLAFVNHDSQKSNVQKFTISSANTWQYVTLTYNGDTAAGFNNDANLGLSLDLFLGGGSDYTGGSATLNNWDTRSNNQSTYVSSTSTKFGTATSHTFNVTGVQLEVGDTATDFEHRTFGDELQRCKRYFESKSFTTFIEIGYSNGTTSAHCILPFLEKRAAPTVTLPAAGTSTNQLSFRTPTGANPSTTGSNSVYDLTTTQGRIQGGSYAGLTAGGVSSLYLNGTASVTFDAEL